MFICVQICKLGKEKNVRTVDISFLRWGIPAIPFGILIKAEDTEKNVLTLKNLLTREQFTDISVEEARKIILESKN